MVEFVLKNPCQQLCIFSAVSLPHKGSRPKLFPKFPVRPRCMLARSQQISPKAICTVSCPSALHARSFQPSSPQAISNSFLPTELCPSNCREIHYRLARAIMHLNYIAGFLPFFEPTVDWDDADTHRRSQPYPFPVTHNTHSGRNLHAFVPLPSSPAHPTLVSHGGLPSHMIVNPAPHFRPASSWPPDSSHPTNAVRSRSSRGEPSNPVHLPLRSTTISAPIDLGSENLPPNPEPRPKKKQRIHVAVPGLRPWPDIADNELISYKSDSISRPSWKM